IALGRHVLSVCAMLSFARRSAKRSAGEHVERTSVLHGTLGWIRNPQIAGFTSRKQGYLQWVIGKGLNLLDGKRFRFMSGKESSDALQNCEQLASIQIDLDAQLASEHFNNSPCQI